jgi:uncharacterized protein
MRSLTDADLDRLHLYLSELGDDAMLLSELDGYLAGVIVCPEMIQPSEWLPEVWGEGHAFESPEEAQELLPIVMAFYNDIARAIGRPRTYVPRLDADADGLAVWELWASGFGRALDLRPWAWSSYNELPEDGPREGLSFRLLNTLAVAADEPGGGDLHEDLAQILREKAEAILGACVEELNLTRLAALKAERPPKIGRNDPCPCGSGEKYKKCCLQAQNQ